MKARALTPLCRPLGDAAEARHRSSLLLWLGEHARGEQVSVSKEVRKEGSK